MLLAFSRFVAFLVGLLAYHIAFFMYEDEEGKWQNRIEKLWVDIDDRKQKAGNKASAFFGRVAAILSRAFNVVFGDRLFSLRFIGTSTCLSFGTVCLFKAALLYSKGISEAALFLSGLLFSFVAILPSLLHSRWAIVPSLLPVLLLTPSLVVLVVMRGAYAMGREGWAFFAGLVLSLLCDVLLVALVRVTVRWVSAKASALRIGLAILIQLSVFYVLILVPLTISVALPDDFRQSVGLMALVDMGALNIFTVFASLTFVLSLLLLLLHRALWPVLGRILYPLARHQVIRNRKAMIALGTGCLIYASVMPTAIEGILRWLAK